MNVLSWFTEPVKPSQSVTEFKPRIVINPKSTLHVEVQPRDPTTTSNITITAFASAQVRSIVAVRVEWSRHKIKSDSTHTTERIHCLSGPTYMCEPGDVGGYIRAHIRSADSSLMAEAEVTVGPIAIDVMIKRLLDGALYSGSLLSQVVVCQKDRRTDVTLRLHCRQMEFIDDQSQEKLTKDYTMSQPKIQLNPKDPTRLYVRFEQDRENVVRQWLNTIFGVRNSSVDESSISGRVPYSHSSGSSKARLFQKSHHAPCPNKLQLKFQSRHSRDLFLFTQRAFICREDMKNSIYIQRIQGLQTISTEADYYKFLEYMSLKYEVWRLADFAKQIEDDRNSKVQNLNDMEDSIAEMTVMYLRIIEEKAKQSNLDLEQSYSQISQARDDVLQRKNIRQLRKQNESLKQRLRQMNEQLQLQKFFKQQENASIVFDQTTNPFAKKGADMSMSIRVNSPGEKASQRNQMYEMSVNYANLMEENRQLKSENKKYKASAMSKGGATINHDRSQNMMEILGSLDEHDEKEAKMNQMERGLNELKRERDDLMKLVQQLRQENANQARALATPRPNASFLNQPSNSHMLSRSVLNLSANSAITESFLNQSITSQAAMMKLEENLRNLTEMNGKLSEDNTRLRRERDHYRTENSKLKQYLKDPNRQEKTINFEDSPNKTIRQEVQMLQNQNNALAKKIDALTRDNPVGLRDELMRKEGRVRELEAKLEAATRDYLALKKREGDFNSDELQRYQNENIKLKKINSGLLEQIKHQKAELEKRSGEQMYSSRVIELQNQLEMAMTRGPNAHSEEDRQSLEKVNELTKQMAKLTQDNKDLQAKLDHQAVTIDKLIVENHKANSPPSKGAGSTLSSTNTKEKCYSQRANQPTVEEVEKYKREVKKLQEEIIFMKRSSDAINRSRDLTMEMDGYYQDKIEVMRKEIEQLLAENENLSRMCERYGRDAKQATKELQMWREKYQQAMKARQDESSLLL